MQDRPPNMQEFLLRIPLDNYDDNPVLDEEKIARVFKRKTPKEAGTLISSASSGCVERCVQIFPAALFRIAPYMNYTFGTFLPLPSLLFYIAQLQC